MVRRKRDRRPHLHPRRPVARVGVARTDGTRHHPTGDRRRDGLPHRSAPPAVLLARLGHDAGAVAGGAAGRRLPHRVRRSRHEGLGASRGRPHRGRRNSARAPQRGDHAARRRREPQPDRRRARPVDHAVANRGLPVRDRVSRDRRGLVVVAGNCRRPVARRGRARHRGPLTLAGHRAHRAVLVRGDARGAADDRAARLRPPACATTSDATGGLSSPGVGDRACLQ